MKVFLFYIVLTLGILFLFRSWLIYNFIQLKKRKMKISLLKFYFLIFNSKTNGGLSPLRYLFIVPILKKEEEYLLNKYKIVINIITILIYVNFLFFLILIFNKLIT